MATALQFLNNSGGVIAIIGGVLWLIYQYLKNKYFASVVVSDDKKEQQILSQIASDSNTIAADDQKVKDDKQLFNQTLEVLNGSGKVDSGDSGNGNSQPR